MRISLHPELSPEKAREGLKPIKLNTTFFTKLKMATKTWAILLLLFTTLLTSSAQILWKKGSATLTFDAPSILTNYYLLGGMLLYVAGGTLLIISFRGGDVSVLYPIIATSYVWVSFFSVFYLNEKMNFFKSIGVVSIIAGIILIGFGSKDLAPGAM